MITFTEIFLNITMEYDAKVGYKGYDIATGATHELDPTISVLTKEVSKQSTPSYSQTTVPITIIFGANPTKVKLEGTLCKVSEVSSYLNGFARHRAVNSLYNVFIPCSILHVDSSSPYNTEIETLGSYWIVDTFKIKRNAQKRDLIQYELILMLWRDWESAVA